MRTPSPTIACPCGAASDFGNCCGKFLAGELPTTPEQLMRSRYTAFVVRDDSYLRSTWHPGTCPDDVSTDTETRWLGLRLLDAPVPEPGARRGIVEFEASYRDGEGDGVLHERSRFVWQSSRWWYLDGVHS